MFRTLFCTSRMQFLSRVQEKMGLARTRTAQCRCGIQLPSFEEHFQTAGFTRGIAAPHTCHVVLARAVIVTEEAMGFNHFFYPFEDLEIAEHVYGQWGSTARILLTRASLHGNVLDEEDSAQGYSLNPWSLDRLRKKLQFVEPPLPPLMI